MAGLNCRFLFFSKLLMEILCIHFSTKQSVMHTFDDLLNKHAMTVYIPLCVGSCKFYAEYCECIMT